MIRFPKQAEDTGNILTNTFESPRQTTRQAPYTSTQLKSPKVPRLPLKSEWAGAEHGGDFESPKNTSFAKYDRKQHNWSDDEDDEPCAFKSQLLRAPIKPNAGKN